MCPGQAAHLSQPVTQIYGTLIPKRKKVLPLILKEINKNIYIHNRN
jgi:hypothetical protein